MAGSNIVAVKRRIIAELPGLLGIVGDYSYVGKRHDGEREYLYLGDKASGSVTAAAMAGGTRFARSEELGFSLAIVVRINGAETSEETEARAVELGAGAEEYLAGNWTTDAIPGLLKLVITATELESGVDDTGATSLLTYTLQAHSHVR
jgi:hypothetical protein